MTSKTPLYKIPWAKLTPKQKMLRSRSLDVISALRNTKIKTFSETARDNNVSTATVLRHTNAMKWVKRRLVVKKWDRVPRIMRVNTNGREKSIEISDSRTASVVGRYHNSVKSFLNTGDKTKLFKFRNKKVKDSKGKLHRLETDSQRIIQINERIEEPEFYEVYNVR